MQNPTITRQFGEEIIKVEPGFYRHFNGAIYEVLMTALDTSTRQESVVYRSHKDAAKVYVAPLDWFLGAVALTKTQEVSRFERIASPVRRNRVAAVQSS